MKTAVRSVFVLAAVFFVASANAAWVTVAPSYFSSQSAAQSWATPDWYWHNGYVATVTVSGRVYTGVNVDQYCPYPDTRCSKNLYWPQGGWSCPAGQEINQETGECVVPPPEVDCSRESGKTTRAKLTAQHGGGYCLPAGQLIDPNAPFSSENFVTGNCAADLDMTRAVIAGVGGGTVAAFTFTGSACSTPEPEAPVPATPEETYPEVSCVTGSSGTVACVSSKMPKNCGEFNGERLCVDDPPSGNCTFVAGGNWACDSAAASPPKPTVPHELTQTGRGPTGQPSTVYVYPPGAEGGDTNSTYTGGGGTGTGDGGSCGGEGQPPCKIDETGTPTVEAGDFDGEKGLLDGAATEAAGSGENPPVGAGAVDGAKNAVASAMPTGSCSPIVISLPFGNEMVLDLYDKCSDFRAAAAWVLGLATALYLITLFLRSPGG